MAIVALVLWLFTAGAGITLLTRSNLGRARPAQLPQEQAAAQVAAHPRAATLPGAPASSLGAGPSQPEAAAVGAANPVAAAEARRVTRGRFDPPSLIASRSAPLVPGPRALLEFMHPACAMVGLGFWLGFTLVHARLLGWIGFGLVIAAACLGLSWFTAGYRAARRAQRRDPGDGDTGAPAPAFSGRLAAVHGTAATVTFVLAAVSMLVLKS